MGSRILTALAVLALSGAATASEEPAEAPAGTAASEAAAAPDAALYRACVEKLPKELAEAEPEGGPPRMSASGPAGSWRVSTADLDGDGLQEAVLVALPEGHKGEVRFFHRKNGDPAGEWESDRIKLEGGAVTRASVDFLPVGNGRTLVHVDAGDGGQALLAWADGDLDTVWKTGKPREGERRWFVLEDLDENGVDEVVEYFQRELDVYYADEDDLEEGAAGGTTTRVDAVAVYRLDGDHWKKDKDLLENRRRR